MMYEEYDERHYPASADSDGESEHTSLLIDNQHKQEYSDDFSCSVCAQVLLDPLTLHCGHSFCQLCLASVWASKSKAPPNTLQCPVCRLPWRNFPGINILLRNVIESKHGDIIDDRRSNLTPSNKKLLDDFCSAKDQSWQTERQEGNNIRLLLGAQERRILTLCLVGTAVCVIAFMILIVALGMWVSSGPGGAFMRKPVQKWTNQDVMAWLEGLGTWPAAQNITKLFQAEGITGPRLVMLNREALGVIGVHSSYRQEVLVQAIEELKTGDITPRNFQEFTAAHRKLSLMIIILYKFWPRLTFGYVFVFAYDGIFIPVLENFFRIPPSNEETHYISWVHVVMFTSQVLLFPHFVVMSFAWVWWSINPWLATAVIAHCLRATFDEGKAIKSVGLSLNNWKALITRIPKDSLSSFIMFLMTVTIVSVLWHITPHFVCDIISYFIIWLSVFRGLLQVILPLLQRLGLFTVRFQHNIRVQGNI